MKLNFLQRFAHNKLGWGYIDWKLGIEKDDYGFQDTYTCVCGSRLTHDSNGDAFHLGEVFKIN